MVNPSTSVEVKGVLLGRCARPFQGVVILKPVAKALPESERKTQNALVGIYYLFYFTSSRRRFAGILFGDGIGLLGNCVV